jgi:hypothetical protein
VSSDKGIDEVVETIKTMSTGANKSKYWDLVVKKHSNISGSIETKKDGTYINGKIMTKQQQKETVKSFLEYANKVSLSDDEKLTLTGDENKILTRLSPPPEKQLNKVYQEQFDLQNKFREDLNKVSKGKGDLYYSKVMLSRLHIDGKEHGRIPKGYLEINMGNNDSGIRYDYDNKPYAMYDVKGKKGYYRCNINGEKIGDVPFKAPNSLTAGDDATVINEDVLEFAFGGKGKWPPDGSGIKVDKVKWGGGSVGTANIYSAEGTVIGVVTYRSKSGKGGRVQDTIQFHPDFQKKLQLLSHYKRKHPEIFKKGIESLRKTGKLDTKKLFGEEKSIRTLYEFIGTNIKFVTQENEFIITNWEDTSSPEEIDTVEESKIRTHFVTPMEEDD